MTTLADYRNALNERNSFDFESVGWRAATLKLEQIIERGLAEKNYQIAREVQDGIYELLDCGLTFENEQVSKLTSLLDDNGFTEMAEEVREYFLED
jgi:hypothetical protein